MTHAYSEMYLGDAMSNLGEAFDYAVNRCGIEIDSFMRLFLSSGLADSFARGNPRVIAGISGTELVMEAVSRTGLPVETPAPQPVYDRTEEYWSGWVLAFYQWKCGLSFRDIHSFISMAQVCRMYYPLHEAPEDRFADAVNEIIRKKQGPSRLQVRRKNFGLSQSELAAKAGVNLRTLQQYELKTKDINKASVSTVLALSSVLGCPAEAILEPSVS